MVKQVSKMDTEIIQDNLNPDFEKGLYHLEESLKYAKEFKDSSRLADIYHDLGNFYRYKNSPKTLDYLDKALNYNPDQTTSYHLFDNKAMYYLENNNFTKAKIYIQKALKILSPSISENYNDIITKEALL